MRRIFILVQGGAQEPQSGFLDCAVEEGAVAVCGVQFSWVLVVETESCGSPQLQCVDKLVHVPVVQFVLEDWSSPWTHGLVQLNVDIPVPSVRGGRGGLQGLRPGQNSTAFGAAEHVGIPVPRGGSKVYTQDRFLLLHPRTRLVL